MRPVVLLTGAATAAVALAASGCSAKNDNPDLVSGKQLFVKNCGACHVLARAGTKGVTGPNLDEAFQQSKADGFGEAAIRGVVERQILYPSRGGIGGQNGVMPAKLVGGTDAADIAAYVAKSVAKKGKDTGILAAAVKSAGSDKPAVAVGGVLTIPADPTGQLLFVNAKAQAPAGSLTIKMPNTSGIPHNIAIDGKGKGEIVSKGESSFTATFTAGTYTYICEVPGHLTAGMKGTLTVK